MLSSLKWLTLLSLDAPLVAVTWQALLARTLGTSLGAHHYLLVAASVWLGYAADRWLDNLKPQRPGSEQHRLYAQRPKAVLAIWLLVLSLSLALAFSTLRTDELVRGFLLMLAAIAYTVFAQRSRGWCGYPLLKSLAIGGLILASALLFQPAQAWPLGPLLGIGLLFTGNCLLIRSWTRPGEKGARRQAYACGLGSLLCLTGGFWSPAAPLAAATLLSLLGLAAIDYGWGEASGSSRRTAADLCLFVPAFLLLL